jgi:hypothetical protein
MAVSNATAQEMRQILVGEGVFKGAAFADGTVLTMLWNARASPEYQACLSKPEVS